MSRQELLVSFDVVLVRVPCGTCQADTVCDLFASLSEAGAVVDLISLVPPRRSSRGGLSFSVINCDVTKVMKAVCGAKPCCSDACIEVSGDYSKIVLKGEFGAETTGVLATFFKALKSSGAEIAMVESSASAIAVLLPAEELDKTLESLEAAFSGTPITYVE